MDLKDEVELANTRRKLEMLQARYDELLKRPTEDDVLRTSTIRSVSAISTSSRKKSRAMKRTSPREIETGTASPFAILSRRSRLSSRRTWYGVRGRPANHVAAFGAADHFLSTTQRKPMEPERSLDGAMSRYLPCWSSVVVVGKYQLRRVGAIVAAAADDGGAGVLVLELVGPLPDVAGHVHDAEGARALRVGVDGVGRREQAVGFDELRHGGWIGLVAPGVCAAVGALGRVLPFPFVRQALAGPGGIGASVFERNPGDRLVFPAGRVVPGQCRLCANRGGSCDRPWGDSGSRRRTS